VHSSDDNLHSLCERSRGGRLWLRLSCCLVGLFFRLIARVQIEGEEYVPSQGGVVLASNHISLLDTLLIPYSIMVTQGVQMVWAPAKAELFRLPVVRRLMASWGAFPVRRGRGDLRAMRRMMDHMQTGKLMLFPEGTRSRDGRLGDGKRALGKLLYEAQPVVVPAVVWGTNRIWPKGKYLPCFRTRIGVRYGKPLDLQRFYALPNTKETAAAIVTEVMRGIAFLLETIEPQAVEMPSAQASS
jgi:1-acyl-sn-glycerol-3-phosphate acyltransferase